MMNSDNTVTSLLRTQCAFIKGGPRIRARRAPYDTQPVHKFLETTVYQRTFRKASKLLKWKWKIRGPQTSGVLDCFSKFHAGQLPVVHSIDLIFEVMLPNGTEQTPFWQGCRCRARTLEPEFCHPALCCLVSSLPPSFFLCFPVFLCFQSLSSCRLLQRVSLRRDGHHFRDQMGLFVSIAAVTCGLLHT